MEWAYSPGNELEEEPEDYLSDSDTEEDTEKAGQNAQKSRNERPVININFQDSDHDSDSDDSEDGSSKKAKKDERAAKSLTYEQQREKQIAENKAKMLEVFGTDSPSLILRDGVTAAKGTKGKERRKGKKADIKEGANKSKGGKAVRKSSRSNGAGSSAGREAST
jgi:hypothetical protein